jgi:hypothetical protein
VDRDPSLSCGPPEADIHTYTPDGEFLMLGGVRRFCLGKYLDSLLWLRKGGAKDRVDGRWLNPRGTRRLWGEGPLRRQTEG